ncbi:MAG: hypothetical protein M9924_21175 [Rhizobiaceae bacterium]|nr:hypothetical protein [Rhizobiaceae bacterium]
MPHRTQTRDDAISDAEVLEAIIRAKHSGKNGRYVDFESGIARVDLLDGNDNARVTVFVRETADRWTVTYYGLTWSASQLGDALRRALDWRQAKFP